MAEMLSSLTRTGFVFCKFNTDFFKIKFLWFFFYEDKLSTEDSTFIKGFRKPELLMCGKPLPSEPSREGLIISLRCILRWLLTTALPLISSIFYNVFGW